MILKEKEKAAIEDLRTQEQQCEAKYHKYGEQAKDPVLKDLFQTLEMNERTHYESLGQVLNGKVPACDCNDPAGKAYEPQATYKQNSKCQDKLDDCFLATDCIATEKMVSSEYNTDVFVFQNSDIRKLLADIQVEEQNHAEMLNKYKVVNGMR